MPLTLGGRCRDWAIAAPSRSQVPPDADRRRSSKEAKVVIRSEPSTGCGSIPVEYLVDGAKFARTPGTYHRTVQQAARDG